MNLIQPPLMIIPWTPQAAGPIESALTLMWTRLHQDDLFRTVFHERDDFTFSEFIQFFSRPNVLVQLCAEVTPDGDIVDIAGMGWLSEFEQLPSLRRATGSFVWLRKYWKEHYPERFGKMLLEYYFRTLGVELLVGMTPGPNRAARLFSRRLKLKYCSVLPGYTSYNGRTCDAHIAIMNYDDFVREYGASSEDVYQVQGTPGSSAVPIQERIA